MQVKARVKVIELGKPLTLLLLLLLIALQSQSKGNVQVNGKVKYMQANG